MYTESNHDENAQGEIHLELFLAPDKRWAVKFAEGEKHRYTDAQMAERILSSFFFALPLEAMATASIEGQR